jgi:polar amino acid transport system permease protein
MLHSAYDVGAKSLRFLEPMTIVGVLFVIVSVLSSFLLRRLEFRYGNN